MTARPVGVAVVGAGPRGTAVLERLTANLGPSGPWADTPAEVHIVEPRTPGAGRVWDPGQPEQLLMNTVAGHATAFPDDTVRMAGPATTGPTLMEWARDHAPGAAPGLQPWEHPRRALMGRYLAWAHERITRSAAPYIRIVAHPTRAIGLDEAPEGRLRLRLDDGTALVVDAVVLATGHTDQRPAPREGELAAAARRHGLTHLPPGHPAEARLDLLQPGEPVLVRGLALNFFDQLTVLTSGRGGRFEQDGPAGRPRYLPSGREPRLLAGSGRGVPYLARPQVQGRMPTGHSLRFFDAAAVERLTAREPGTVGFMAEVWPLIVREAGAAWYRTLLEVRPGAARLPAAALLDRYAAAGDRTGVGTDPVAEHLYDPADRFDPFALDRPLEGRRFRDRAEFGAWLAERMYEDLDAARAPERSPLKAAAAAIAAVKGQVRRVVAAGVLSGSSYRELSWFRSFGAHIASGPPASRIAELAALYEAGVVEFMGARPAVTVDAAAGGFVAMSATTDGPPATARALLDAWLPGADLALSADPLLRGLVASGLARPHTAASNSGSGSGGGGGGGGIATGALDVCPSDLRVRDAAGRPHLRLFAFGVPVEGVHWNTAIGARARANAEMFRQADAIARSVLGATRVRPDSR
ncbi:FAD/NAD(P)-binding protein [Streptomyces scopuliridis]|uniref:FAD/NAD(P)-binding protein n=1 Tax=Streptomyces scopuliridis TaxID=452529 RepID=A0ACD4ZUH4_9ACTN|nr:FAD/NAD(P)-binding protein [Streptomyces scopuliridis]WSC02105.1 FAD/NAD(P)-binding protein [Streptomyces scopuliridis]WSC04358.1 FAD/NAD(P)-binding protein [Streptomyces scopuliridis]